MTENNMFEIASERRFRFPYKGQITVEDLWDLDKKALNEVYKLLSTAVRAGEVTLLDVETSEDKDLQTRIEIVAHIFNKKVEKENKALHAKEASIKKQRIMEIMGKKQDESLENTPMDELQKMLDDL